MSTKEVVAAIKKDPAVLADPELRSLFKGVILDLISDGLVPAMKPKYRAPAPEVGDGWITYAMAATLPGVGLVNVRSWVSRGHVQGGEGWVNAEDLLRYLERDSVFNKQQIAAAELRMRLPHYLKHQGKP